MADPVSWLQIAQGWNVVTTDDVLLGNLLAQVEGDKQSDIFDGLAVESQSKQLLYVPRRAGRGDLSRSGHAEDRLRGDRRPRAVPGAAAADDVASGQGTARNPDLELAPGQALAALVRRDWGEHDQPKATARVAPTARLACNTSDPRPRTAEDERVFFLLRPAIRLAIRYGKKLRARR